MKLLKILKSFLPPVKLQPIKGLTRDLRAPKDPWKAALHAHRQKRRRECRRATATYFPVILEQSPPNGGRSSHPIPATQRPLGRAELQPTALHLALTLPAFMRRQAN